METRKEGRVMSNSVRFFGCSLFSTSARFNMITL